MTPSSPEHSPSLGYWLRWIVLPLVLAAATVALIARTEKQEMEIAITASFTNLADNLLIMDNSRHTVRLLVTGTTSALKSMDLKSAVCHLDLSGLDAGTHTLPVPMSAIRLPKGVYARELLTPSLIVRLEPMTSKTVGVIAVLEGSPAPGYAVVAVKLAPDHIDLKGTQAMLSAIETVKTRPINLEAAAESFKKQVPLNLPEAIAVDPPLRIVVAEVTIKERIVNRVMENIPVKGRGTTDTYRIEPKTITLTVNGPESVVNNIESDPAFAVAVDMTGLSPGVYLLKAAINLPVQTKLVRVRPERFSVTIEK